MIRLGDQEIAYMLRYRQKRTDEILSSIDAGYKKKGAFVAKDSDDIRMLACVLWDLAAVIEAQVQLGSPVAGSFTSRASV